MFARLQTRIAAGYIGLIALILLALGVYLVWFLRAHQLAALQDQLRQQAALVSDLALNEIETHGPSGLDPLAKRIGGQIGSRITIIAIDGTVLGDSENDPATMENHGSRPEVVAALRTGVGLSLRLSATMEESLLYAAVPIAPSGGAPVGVARVAVPMSVVENAQRRTLIALAGSFAVAALLAVALAILLAGVTTSRIRALTRAAHRLAAGGPAEMSRVAGDDEVGLLARTLGDVTRHLNAQIQAADADRGRLAAVLEHMGDGVVMVDGQGCVQILNAAAGRLLAVDPAAVVRQSVISALRDHELAQLVQDAMADGDQGERTTVIDLSHPSHGRFVQASAVAIPARGPTDPRVLLILHDVTDVRRAEVVRREFVANISHELRTPVASLKALVEILQDGAIEDRSVVHEFLRRIDVEVDRLAQLVAELLDLARIESGQVLLRREPILLSDVASAAAERLRPLASRRGVDLSIDASADLPTVLGDAAHMEQVVVNLVHNAIKFTPAGGSVRVSTRAQDGRVAIVVADTGVGIKPEALPRLFERFYKGEPSRSGGGTGLGLAIAKHVVQALGGTISAASPGEGRGATFTICFPVSDGGC
ncbi:MAG TPA: ATP-binding protein [Chloroflexota bacterium]|nr:ATP-binding protein [Chloroflexota bacterium]